MYEARAELLGRAALGGLISFAGQEYAFNDPSSPWESSLDQNIEAQLSGRAIGAKIGAAFLWNDWIALDVCFDRTPELVLTGNVDFVQHVVPAMNGGGDGEVLDPTRLNIARMTETKIYENPTSDTLLVELPSALRLSLGCKRGPWGAVVGYGRYFGEFRAAYMDQVIGVRPVDCIRTGFRCGPTRFGASIFRMAYYSGKREQPSDPENIIVPTISLGVGFKISSATSVETQIVGVPGPFLNITVIRAF
jgi:hypothetical protein